MPTRVNILICNLTPKSIERIIRSISRIRNAGVMEVLRNLYARELLSTNIEDNKPVAVPIAPASSITIKKYTIFTTIILPVCLRCVNVDTEIPT